MATDFKADLKTLTADLKTLTGAVQKLDDKVQKLDDKVSRLLVTTDRLSKSVQEDIDDRTQKVTTCTSLIQSAHVVN